MSGIKIDRRVPMPKIIGPGRPPKYPWRQMKIGDSFEAGAHGAGIGGCIVYAAQSTGFKFTQRRTGKNTVRVWRIK